MAGFDSLFTGYSTIDDDFYEELEEILIMGDIGINATTAILDKLKDQVEIRNIRDPKECKQLLIDTIKEQMTVDSTEYEFEKPQIRYSCDRCQWCWKNKLPLENLPAS